MPRCSAKSKTSGQRCKRPAIPGGRVCRYHGGAAPQVKRKAEERLEATRERVLLELCRLAYVDPRKLFTKGGKLRLITALDADTARAIKSISFGEYGNIEAVRLVDKKGALDSIAKHLGMFKEQVEHSGPDGAPIDHKLEIILVKPNAHAVDSPDSVGPGAGPNPAV